MQQVLKEFNDAVAACLKKASDIYGVNLSTANVEILNDVKGRAAGWAHPMRYGKYKLRFNLEAIEKHNEQMTKDTIPHEVAHLVCYARPELGKKHDAGWKAVCRRLGGDDSRTHHMLLTPTKVKEIVRFQYNVSGYMVNAGPRQHKALQDGTKRYFVTHPTKGRLEILYWMWTDAAVKLDRTTRTWTANDVPTQSKKERALAIWYKSANLTRGEVIKLFVKDADMTPAGAATYYQNFKSGKY